MNENTKFKVSVRCFTYNQADYITDTMDGFTMQQTNFPFVCCIVDDASTDGEQNVITNYVDKNFNFSEEVGSYKIETDYAFISFAQHCQNKNCYFAVLLLKENLYSKNEKDKKHEYISEWVNPCDYIAICEGDDYWIDSKKLQVQVDFMNTHSDYSLCYHDAFYYMQESRKVRIFVNMFDRDVDLSTEQAITNWAAPTASILYRKSLYDGYPSNLAKIYSRDYSLMLILLSRGKVRYIDRIMSVYRRTEKGVTSTTDMSFAYSEHIRLLVSYDKFTENKYHDIILKRIKFLKKLIAYIEVRHHYKVYKIFSILPFLFRKFLK